MQKVIAVMPLYAHTPNEEGHWHNLVDHLANVASLAKKFGEKFGAGDWAELAGWWHDVGKVNPEFQQYLKRCAAGDTSCEKGPPHSIIGALWAARQGIEGLSLIIAGHHGGIPSLSALKTQRFALAKSDPHCQSLLETVETLGVSNGHGSGQPTLATKVEMEFFLRMVFSALVDADFLDTEAHKRPEAAMGRAAGPSLVQCWERLSAAQNGLSGKSGDTLNLARHNIYQACLEAAKGRQGFFRLTVPTGGGKTRSGMAFALRHALAHGLERAIVAIPYTSIIDQNAMVYRQIFGEEAVLEHHSQADWRSKDDPENAPESALRQRLASENWDAPIIVTTTVQLFESLFSNRVAACRKLHNLAKSVLILDEVQTLPEGLLEPILDVLKELVARYQVTVVFSSATQPAFERVQGAVKDAVEIIPQADRYFETLKRVEYRRFFDPWTWETVAERVRQHPSAMVVLNRKKDALAVLDALGDPDAFHLSTLLCPAHRKRILAEVHSRLANKRSCRLIATQVVEAGVDLDFPVVFRAMGPLDRIVQAAGRCNRENRLPAPGQVFIFQPAEGGAPRGPYASGLGNALSLLSDPSADLHDPGLYAAYFQRQYQSVNTDAKKIQEKRNALDYPEVAERFRMIEAPTAQVLVRKGLLEQEQDEVCRWSSGLAFGRCNPRMALRKLQPYTVSLYERDLKRALAEGLAIPFTAGLYEWNGKYDARRGLVWDAPDPADLIV